MSKPLVPKEHTGFQNERLMVRTLAKQLRDRFGSHVTIRYEVQMRRGVADLLLRRRSNGHLIAIEVKLRDWSRALFQVSRYRSVADRLFVAIDERNSRPLLDHIEWFRNQDVGVIAVSPTALKLYHWPLGLNKGQPRPKVTESAQI